MQSVVGFWEKISFFGSRIETVGAGWSAIIVIAFVLAGAFALVPDPYLITLGASLLLSAIAFLTWQSTLRQTFSQAVESGMVSSSAESADEFLRYSREFGLDMCSQRRFIPIALALALTISANWVPILSWAHGVWTPQVEAIQGAILVALILFSYAVGAAAWCLIATALWIAKLSRGRVLSMQVGHSDGCSGLEPIGTCCLQSAIPFLIGMVLCLIWTKSSKLPFFKEAAGGSWIQIIVPVSYFAMIVLFALACALVFLPVQGLHRQMADFKRRYELEHTRELESALSKVREALASEDADRTKQAFDRMKLVQTLDPTELKLAMWPFDRTSLTKYAVAPIGSLLASLGHKAYTILMKP